MTSDRPSSQRGQTSPVSRRLLARVRSLMAGPGTAQERLDKIVEILAAEMVAEVCSVYVRRAGDMLELFATEGLKATAVHHTHLRVGEGLVGDIAAHARPLALSDAQSHPNFAYRPETGEEVFHSLMGVPVLRGGRVIGVLVVQNRTQRHYSEEEVETLETVAMVLAEMVASGELVNRAELVPVDGIAIKPLRIEGLRLHGGIGIGTAVLHRTRRHVTQMVSDDPAAEHDRLRRAYNEMHGALDNMLEDDAFADGGEHREILEAYRMIARDSGWLNRISEAIDGGLTAEAAVEKVQNDVRARMSQVADAYLRERLHDMDDLAGRLLGHLMGDAVGKPGESLPDDIVLVARALGPAQLFDYDPPRLRAVVLEEGSPTTHAAIVARALDIPVVAMAEGITDRVDDGDTVIVDGDNGRVYVRPGEDVQDAFQDALRVQSEQAAAYAAFRELPAETRDGIGIGLYMNAGLLIDMSRLELTGADGIGLYRTEVPFMVRASFPDVAEQEAIYGEILDAADGKPVVFRTLDVGGDKVLPYWEPSGEENPAMGWRSIRISLDRPALLRHQLRALVRAAAGRELHIMFPMVAEVSEFLQARRLLEMELERERARGTTDPTDVRVGCVLEVPALAFQLHALLRHADFLSVGSNDLLQFLFASDRGNTRLAGRYDTLAPSVLAFLRQVAEAGHAAGKPVTLCGEMAGWPVDAMALIGVGFRNLSVVPSAVAPIRAMVRSLDVRALTAYMASLSDADDHSLRVKLRGFAKDHGVMI